MTRTAPDPTLVARLRAAGCVFAEQEALLLASAATSPEVLEGLLARRLAGEPLEQVVGWADFAGVRVRVAPGVFVPRQRTALMVELAAGRLVPGDVVIDLGCGTGALAAAVAARVPGLEVYAVDIDPAAVDIARVNLPGASVACGDLFAPLPIGLRERVAVVLANLPYVPAGEVALMPREARDHEHAVALDGGADGLDPHRRMLTDVSGWLRPGGAVLTECGDRQVAALQRLVEAAGLATGLHTDPEIGAVVVSGVAGGVLR